MISVQKYVVRIRFLAIEYRQTFDTNHAKWIIEFMNEFTNWQVTIVLGTYMTLHVYVRRFKH